MILLLIYLSRSNAKRKTLLIGNWNWGGGGKLYCEIKSGSKCQFKPWLELIFPLPLQQTHPWWKAHFGKPLGWEHIMSNSAFLVSFWKQDATLEKAWLGILANCRREVGFGSLLWFITLSWVMAGIYQPARTVKMKMSRAVMQLPAAHLLHTGQKY